MSQSSPASDNPIARFTTEEQGQATPLYVRTRCNSPSNLAEAPGRYPSSSQLLEAASTTAQQRLNFVSDGVDAASDTGQSVNSSPSIEDRPSIEIMEALIHQNNSSTSFISNMSVNSGGYGGAYFSRTTARTEAEVLAKQVVMTKDKRGKPGSRERGIHYSAATGAITLKFSAARHFVPTSQEG